MLCSKMKLVFFRVKIISWIFKFSWKKIENLSVNLNGKIWEFLHDHSVLRKEAAEEGAPAGKYF